MIRKTNAGRLRGDEKCGREFCLLYKKVNDRFKLEDFLRIGWSKGRSVLLKSSARMMAQLY